MPPVFTVGVGIARVTCVSMSVHVSNRTTSKNMEALERLINKAPDEFLEAFRDYLHGANQIGWDQFSPEELGTITKF